MSRTGFGSTAFPNAAGSFPSSSTRSAAPAPQSDVYAPAYLAEQRRSEINDMRNSLNEAINKRSSPQVTQALERIMAAMTIGMDVSELFNSVIMASHTQDLVQKKMIYLFLIHYATENEKVALLAVNSLVRDTHDDSPMIRGLALRHLLSMRVPSLVEHMIDPLKRCLVDINTYVRHSAALGCAKLYYMAPDVVKDPAIVNKLYELLRDPDPLVIVNSIRALEEILAEEGGMAINQRIVLHLLSKLTSFNEWGQVTILKLLEKYTPADDEELISILNVLDQKFSSGHAGLVMATAHLFLNYTQTSPDLHQHVYMRLRNPLLSLLIASAPELQQVILSHLLLIAKRAPSLFADDFRLFYVKDSDPEYLKLLKVKVALQLANLQNAKEIISELSSYVNHPHHKEFVKESIKAVGRLAMQFPSVSEAALEQLLGFLELLQLPHVMETTLETMKDLLRRFPDSAQDIIPRLAESLDLVDSPNSIAAILAMIGEYGHIIDDSPYALEEAIGKWEEQNGKVRAQLLIATLKLFFKRPVEVKPILGKLFQKSLEDYSHPDVHDRALFFYRLLSSDIEKCKEVVNSSSRLLNTYFVEDQDSIEIDRLFEEFNTLSVIFRKPSERFIRDFKANKLLEEGSDEEDETLAAEAQAERFRLEEEALYQAAGDNPMAAFQEDESAPPPTASYTPVASLLDLSDQSDATSSSSPLQLNSAVSIDPPTFEKTWKSLTPAKVLKTSYSGRIADLKALDVYFKSNSIKAVAQGANGPLLRFFLYAQVVSPQALILIEFALNTQDRAFVATFKSADPETAEKFADHFEQLLQSS